VGGSGGSVAEVTFVRPAPSLARRVDVVTGAQRAEVERLAAADPLVNAVVASRLAASCTLEPARLGGVLLGSRHGARLSGAVFNGGNLLPIGGEADDWTALAEQVGRVSRVCTSIVGAADAVTAMWAVLEPHWGPARAIRNRQPLLALHRGDPITARPHRQLRVMHPDEIGRYLPAAAAMFEEELGISPFAGRNGGSYRRRVENLLAAGRSFGIADRAGRMEFKADIGAVTDRTCQLQGVWVRPDLRGQGLGTAALAAVLGHALRLAPSASLYVNEFNTAGRRMYEKVGMQQVATLKTVLF
jgi:uncharacterized protein